MGGDEVLQIWRWGRMGLPGPDQGSASPKAQGRWEAMLRGLRRSTVRTRPGSSTSTPAFEEKSNFLRYPLNEELVSEAPNVNETAVQLIKFHGSYQQSDREVCGQKNYSFMLRTKNFSGKVPNQLYLAMDTLADEFGIGTLRLTTRQTFQLHDVLKKNLKHVISTVIKNMGSTLVACGDLNRNVLASVAPYVRKDILFAQETAENIAALLATPGAYYDLWVDGEKIMSAEEPPEVTKARNDNSHGTNFPDSPEEIHGTQYPPRMFKMAVTVAGDNSVDILTNDIGLVVVFVHVGKFLFPMRRSQQFPWLADPLGYVPKEDISYVIKAIVVTQRENGRRDDRRYSRLKYLLDSSGIDKFRAEVEKYYGKKFEDFRPLPKWQFNSYLGWQEAFDKSWHISRMFVRSQHFYINWLFLEILLFNYFYLYCLLQGDGKLFYGVHIDNGRLGGQAKKTLMMIIERYNLDVSITPNQNLILCGVDQAWREPITAPLAQAGLLEPKDVDLLNITSMSCLALPLCPLAQTEVGIKEEESVLVRITGCPNGCARPYMVEVGFVGDGPNSYQLGGTPNQTTLAETFMNKVKLQDIEKVLEPLFSYRNSTRQKA
ncbi:hypothetical protein ZWY2020_030043 [Hordeum vulgare]|nr:hypothetical protein ZWY2020_030043 [Hordeum vulgare]